MLPCVLRACTDSTYVDDNFESPVDTLETLHLALVDLICKSAVDLISGAPAELHSTREHDPAPVVAALVQQFLLVQQRCIGSTGTLPVEAGSSAGPTAASISSTAVPTTEPHSEVELTTADAANGSSSLTRAFIHALIHGRGSAATFFETWLVPRNEPFWVKARIRSTGIKRLFRKLLAVMLVESDLVKAGLCHALVVFLNGPDGTGEDTFSMKAGFSPHARLADIGAQLSRFKLAIYRQYNEWKSAALAVSDETVAGPPSELPSFDAFCAPIEQVLDQLLLTQTALQPPGGAALAPDWGDDSSAEWAVGTILDPSVIASDDSVFCGAFHQHGTPWKQDVRNLVTALQGAHGSDQFVNVEGARALEASLARYNLPLALADAPGANAGPELASSTRDPNTQGLSLPPGQGLASGTAGTNIPSTILAVLERSMSLLLNLREGLQTQDVRTSRQTDSNASSTSDSLDGENAAFEAAAAAAAALETETPALSTTTADPKRSDVDATGVPLLHPAHKQESRDATCPLGIIRDVARWMFEVQAHQAKICDRRAMGLHLLSDAIRMACRFNTSAQVHLSAMEWVVQEARTSFALLRWQDQKARSFLHTVLTDAAANGDGGDVGLAQNLALAGEWGAGVLVGVVGSPQAAQQAMLGAWWLLVRDIMGCLDIPSGAEHDLASLTDLHIAVCACIGSLPLPFGNPTAQQNAMDIVLSLHSKYQQITAAVQTQTIDGGDSITRLKRRQLRFKAASDDAAICSRISKKKKIRRVKRHGSAARRRQRTRNVGPKLPQLSHLLKLLRVCILQLAEDRARTNLAALARDSDRQIVRIYRLVLDQLSDAVGDFRLKTVDQTLTSAESSGAESADDTGSLTDGSVGTDDTAGADDSVFPLDSNGRPMPLVPYHPGRHNAPAYMAGWQCDVCGFTSSDADPGDVRAMVRFHSKEQSQDLCLNCGPAGPGVKVQRPNCRGQHGLQEFITPHNRFNCDLCSAVIPHQTTLFGCRECDYDACPKCYGVSAELLAVSRAEDSVNSQLLMALLNLLYPVRGVALQCLLASPEARALEVLCFGIFCAPTSTPSLRRRSADIIKDTLVWVRPGHGPAGTTQVPELLQLPQRFVDELLRSVQNAASPLRAQDQRGHASSLQATAASNIEMLRWVLQFARHGASSNQQTKNSLVLHNVAQQLVVTLRQNVRQCVAVLRRHHQSANFLTPTSSKVHPLAPSASTRDAETTALRMSATTIAEDIAALDLGAAALFILGGYEAPLAEGSSVVMMPAQQKLLLHSYERGVLFSRVGSSSTLMDTGVLPADGNQQVEVIFDSCPTEKRKVAVRDIKAVCGEVPDWVVKELLPQLTELVQYAVVLRRDVEHCRFKVTEQTSQAGASGSAKVGQGETKLMQQVLPQCRTLVFSTRLQNDRKRLIAFGDTVAAAAAAAAAAESDAHNGGTPRNRAGAKMHVGTGSGARTLYCGRRLGVVRIPGSDGRCGPNNGPPCPDCFAYQQMHGLPKSKPAVRSSWGSSSGDGAPSLSQLASSSLASSSSSSSAPSSGVNLRMQSGRLSAGASEWRPQRIQHDLEALQRHVAALQSATSRTVAEISGSSEPDSDAHAAQPEDAASALAWGHHESNSDSSRSSNHTSSDDEGVDDEDDEADSFGENNDSDSSSDSESMSESAAIAAALRASLESDHSLSEDEPVATARSASSGHVESESTAEKASAEPPVPAAFIDVPLSLGTQLASSNVKLRYSRLCYASSFMLRDILSRPFELSKRDVENVPYAERSREAKANDAQVLPVLVIKSLLRHPEICATLAADCAAPISMSTLRFNRKEDLEALRREILIMRGQGALPPNMSVSQAADGSGVGSGFLPRSALMRLAPSASYRSGAGQQQYFLAGDLVRDRNTVSHSSSSRLDPRSGSAQRGDGTTSGSSSNNKSTLADLAGAWVVLSMMVTSDGLAYVLANIANSRVTRVERHDRLELAHPRPLPWMARHLHEFYRLSSQDGLPSSVRGSRSGSATDPPSRNGGSLDFVAVQRFLESAFGSEASLADQARVLQKLVASSIDSKHSSRNGTTASINAECYSTAHRYFEPIQENAGRHLGLGMGMHYHQMMGMYGYRRGGSSGNTNKDRSAGSAQIHPSARVLRMQERLQPVRLPPSQRQVNGGRFVARQKQARSELIDIMHSAVEYTGHFQLPSAAIFEAIANARLGAAAVNDKLSAEASKAAASRAVELSVLDDFLFRIEGSIAVQNMRHCVWTLISAATKLDELAAARTEKEASPITSSITERAFGAAQKEFAAFQKLRRQQAIADQQRLVQLDFADEAEAKALLSNLPAGLVASSVERSKPKLVNEKPAGKDSRTNETSDCNDIPNLLAPSSEVLARIATLYDVGTPPEGPAHWVTSFLRLVAHRDNLGSAMSQQSWCEGLRALVHLGQSALLKAGVRDLVEASRNPTFTCVRWGEALRTTDLDKNFASAASRGSSSGRTQYNDVEILSVALPPADAQAEDNVVNRPNIELVEDVVLTIASQFAGLTAEPSSWKGRDDSGNRVRGHATQGADASLPPTAKAACVHSAVTVSGLTADDTGCVHDSLFRAVLLCLVHPNLTLKRFGCTMMVGLVPKLSAKQIKSIPASSLTSQLHTLLVEQSTPHIHSQLTQALVELVVQCSLHATTSAGASLFLSQPSKGGKKARGGGRRGRGGRPESTSLTAYFEQVMACAETAASPDFASLPSTTPEPRVKKADQKRRRRGPSPSPSRANGATVAAGTGLHSVSDTSSEVGQNTGLAFVDTAPSHQKLVFSNKNTTVELGDTSSETEGHGNSNGRGRGGLRAMHQMYARTGRGRPQRENWRVAYMNQAWSTGTSVYWEVEVEDCRVYDSSFRPLLEMIVGVASTSAKTSRSTDTVKSLNLHSSSLPSRMWGLGSARKLYQDGQHVRLGGPIIVAETTIGMLLDMVNGELSFFANGKQFGITFNDLLRQRASQSSQKRGSRGAGHTSSAKVSFVPFVALNCTNGGRMKISVRPNSLVVARAPALHNRLSSLAAGARMLKYMFPGSSPPTPERWARRQPGSTPTHPEAAPNFFEPEEQVLLQCFRLWKLWICGSWRIGYTTQGMELEFAGVPSTVSGALQVLCDNYFGKGTISTRDALASLDAGCSLEVSVTHKDARGRDVVKQFAVLGEYFNGSLEAAVSASASLAWREAHGRLVLQEDGTGHISLWSRSQLAQCQVARSAAGSSSRHPLLSSAVCKRLLAAIKTVDDFRAVVFHPVFSDQTGAGIDRDICSLAKALSYDQLGTAFGVSPAKMLSTLAGHDGGSKVLKTRRATAGSKAGVAAAVDEAGKTGVVADVVFNALQADDKVPEIAAHAGLSMRYVLLLRLNQLLRHNVSFLNLGRPSVTGVVDLILRNKARVFTQTKVDFLKDLLVRTEVPTRLHEENMMDDYAQPRTIPTICVDRQRASALTPMSKPDAIRRCVCCLQRSAEHDHVSEVCSASGSNVCVCVCVCARFALNRYSLLSQVQRQLENNPVHWLRQTWSNASNTQPRAFMVDLKGEDADDMGGPYRALFADIFHELQNRQLQRPPLFCDSPNAAQSEGEDRHVKMLNPAWRSREQLEQLHCLGRLLGTALRCGIEVEVNLPLLVWRRMVAEVPNWRSDVRQVDAGLCETLSYILQHERQLSSRQVSVAASQPMGPPSLQPQTAADEALAGRTFVLPSCDGRELQLVPNGRVQPLTPSNYPLFASLATRMRLHESAVQMEELFSGLAQVIPMDPLALLTCDELTEHVCGRQDVDVDLLKSCAVYPSFGDDASTAAGAASPPPHFEYLFEALRSFEPELRVQFLKFAFALSRLPSVCDCRFV